jgi:hypothetical protein
MYFLKQLILFLLFAHSLFALSSFKNLFRFRIARNVELHEKKQQLSQPHQHLGIYLDNFQDLNDDLKKNISNERVKRSKVYFIYLNIFIAKFFIILNILNIRMLV